jgi:hypothetical protein
MKSIIPFAASKKNCLPNTTGQRIYLKDRKTPIEYAAGVERNSKYDDGKS